MSTPAMHRHCFEDEFYNFCFFSSKVVDMDSFPEDELSNGKLKNGWFVKQRFIGVFG